MYGPNLPDHCTPTNAFLTQFSANLHICVPTTLAFISTLLGWLSILSWLCAQIPQVYTNYTLKSASGLSIFFLAEWMLGDSANLVGSLFTKQAAWQVVLAGYYVSVDLCLVFQYLWYSRLKPWRQKRLDDQKVGTIQEDNGDSAGMLLAVSPPEGEGTANPPMDGTDDPPSSKPRDVKSNPFRMLNFSFSPREKSTPPSPSRSISRPSGALGPSPRTILLISMLLALLTNASPLHPTSTPPPTESTPFETAGRFLSWISTVLYLGSRLPQIYKNYRRRSTAGLSPALFIAAFFGNLFYSSSLLTNPLAWDSYAPNGLHGWVGPDGSDRVEWVSLAAPFWLGSAGVLVMDGIIGLQFLRYGEEKKLVVVTDERGRSRWRKVSGWMRGWVPSPGLSQERPLLQRRETERGYGTA
ncbi:MAG: hypothetical protein Q9195_002793 [Heterodermia aff. obscurata]